MAINTVAVSFNPACRVTLNFMYSKCDVIENMKVCCEVNIAVGRFPKHTKLCGWGREFVVVTRLRDRRSGVRILAWTDSISSLNVQTGSGLTKTPIKRKGIC